MSKPEVDKDFDIAVGDSVEPTERSRGSYKVTAVNRKFPYIGGAMVEVSRTEFVSLEDLKSGKWKVIERISREPSEFTAMIDLDPAIIKEIEERDISWSDKLKELTEKAGLIGYNVTYTDREPRSSEEYAKELFYLFITPHESVKIL